MSSVSIVTNLFIGIQRNKNDIEMNGINITFPHYNLFASDYICMFRR